MQTFVPTKPLLRGVRLNLGDVSAGGEFAVGIYNVVSGGHFPTRSTLGEVTETAQTFITDNQLVDEEFIFATPINVTTGTRYAIQII